MDKQDINGIEELHDTSTVSSLEGAFNESLIEKSLIENLPGIFFLYSFPELRMVRWNKNHETLFGFSSPEIKGRHILDWFHQKNHSTVLRSIKTLNIEGKHDFESELVTKDKESVPYLLSMKRIEFNRKASIIGTGIDLSDRKEMEEVLKRSKSDLSSILNEMNGAVWSVSWPERRFGYLSPSAEILYGRPLKEMMGHEDQSYEFTHPDDKAIIAQVTIELDSDGVSEQEFRVVLPDGRIVWVNSRCKMVYDERGNPIRVDGFDTDITVRKELEEAYVSSKKAMLEKNAQVQNTLQEIKTSLSAIVDEAERACQNEGTGTGNKTLERVVQIANDLLTMIKPICSQDNQ